MIVIGDDHSFSKQELESIRLMSSDIEYIASGKLDPDLMSEKIESLTNQEKHKKAQVLLNTKETSLNDLLDVLTKIEKKNETSSFTIKTFFEEKLRKIYVPSSMVGVDDKDAPSLRAYSSIETIQKRTIDYIGALTLVALFWPFMLYSVYKIKKESPEGPVFFKQKRVGLNGKEFYCVKFRSMNIDAEKNGAQFATDDDPRVFPWGKIMRATRIDELPQVINVLKGEMHFVGPRPERKHWTDQFDQEIPFYNKRHLVAPGITGWAQVMYPYGENVEDARQKLMYDLYYMKKWNLLFELETIIRTVLVVLGKKGL